MKVYSRLSSYAFKYKFHFAFYLFFVIIITGAQIAGILGIGNFFSNAFIGRNFEKVNLMVIAGLLGLGFIWAFSHYFIYLLSNTLAVNVMHDIRFDVFRKLIDLPVFYYKKNKSGEIMSRILNDVGIIENFFMNIAMDLFLQPMIFISVIIYMFVLNTRLSLYFLSIGPVIAIVIASLGAIVQRLSLSVQKNISDITSGIEEAIYGIDIIKGYGVEESIKLKFSESNDSHLNAVKREMRIRFLGTPSSEFFGVIAVLLILFLGALSVQRGIATPQDIINFFFAVMVLSQPFSRTSDILMVLRKLQPAGARVFELIDSREKENTDFPDFGIIKGDLEWKRLYFQYENDRTALSKINLSVRHGETVAIVGPSGAGKTTFISLVPVFYHPVRGEFLIDGKDVSHYNPGSIRSQISLVTQESILFSGSIIENIRLSKPEAGKKEVIEAAKIANADQFISELPQGYETILGERGVKLSGGEKQRIALARAVLRKPKILILDEATSSLDAKSEQLIQKAMKGILGNQTTLIVSHKLSTIMNADRIVVLENGKIIEIGTHAELLSQGGIYKKLFNIQASL
jgi:subfamily B ATP-binding cassette protein MsbA